MKILKYTAVMLAALLAYSSYAQDAAPAAQAPVIVKVSTVKGVSTYDIVVNPSAELSSEEAIKRALEAALKNLDSKSLDAKAISASLLAVKAALADKTAPLTAPMTISVKVEQRLVNDNNVAAVATIVTSGNISYTSNTETTVNAGTDVAQTTGNISVSENGKVSSLPVSVGTNSNGELVGTVGNAGVTDTVASATTEPTVSTTPTSEQSSNASVETLPDSTVVTSGQQ